MIASPWPTSNCQTSAMPSGSTGRGGKTSSNSKGQPNGRIGTPRGSSNKKAPNVPMAQTHSGMAAGTQAGTLPATNANPVNSQSIKPPASHSSHSPT
ncbi:hypothetical protein D9M71_643110 [compost metagenome]